MYNIRCVAILATILACNASHCIAGIINAGVFTGTPEDSWSYAEFTNAGKGQSVSYFPTSQSEFSSAVFQGYVTYDPTVGSPPHGWTGPGFDTIQVFTTHVLSSVDQVITVRIGGDDGHSLFVDGIFAAGGGFGATIDFNLSLTAGVSRELQLAGYNGPGNWVFGIGVPGHNNTIAGPLQDVPNVRVSATNEFAAVPEPASFAILAVGMGAIPLLRRRWPRSNKARSSPSCVHLHI